MFQNLKKTTTKDTSIYIPNYNILHLKKLQVKI